MSAGAHIGVMCLGLFAAVLSAQNCLGNNLPASAPIARQNAKKRPSRGYCSAHLGTEKYYFHSADYPIFVNGR